MRRVEVRLRGMRDRLQTRARAIGSPKRWCPWRSADLASLIAARAVFDPRTDTRTFSIASSDNAVATIGIPLTERLRSEAGPGIRVSFRNADATRIADQMERGEVDLLIDSERMVPASMKARRLVDERFVVAHRKRHPRGSGPLDLDTYCNELQHVLVSTSGGSFEGFMDEHLARLGRRRNVVLSIQQFMLVPAILQETDYVCTLPSRLAARYSGTLDAFELPFDAQGFALFLAWHPRNHSDAAHEWLRRLVERCVVQDTASAAKTVG